MECSRKISTLATHDNYSHRLRLCHQHQETNEHHPNHYKLTHHKHNRQYHNNAHYQHQHHHPHHDHYHPHRPHHNNHNQFQHNCQRYTSVKLSDTRYASNWWWQSLMLCTALVLFDSFLTPIIITHQHQQHYQSGSASSSLHHSSLHEHIETPIVTDEIASRYFASDEKHEQSVAFKFHTKFEQRQMEKEILNVFGLPRRPKRRARNNRSRLLKESARKYLYDVYRTLEAEQPGWLKENLTPEQAKRMPSLYQEFSSNLKNSKMNERNNLFDILEADRIVSFINQIKKLRHSKTRRSRFWFNITDLATNKEYDRLIDAEFRLFRDLRFSQLNSSINLHFNVFQLKTPYVGKGMKLHLIDSLTIPGDHSGWLRFNVTEAFINWLQNPNENYGLYFTIISDNLGKKNPKAVGIITQIHGYNQYQPFLTAYIKTATPEGSGSAPVYTPVSSIDDGYNDRDEGSSHYTEKNMKMFREKAVKESEIEEEHQILIEHSNRTTNTLVGRSRRDAKKRSSNISYYDHDVNNPYLDNVDRQSPGRKCHKRDLYVNFRDLNWDDWIIAPDGYMAHFCDGECIFPLAGMDFHPTNHAILQNLIYIMNQHTNSVPRPCCAPRELSSIMVLYFDDNSNVVLQKFKNMVVKSCSCQ